MPTYKVGDLVRVPFPYTDRPTRQHRPAFVAAAGELTKHHGLLWVVMVTSADNRGWPGDVLLDPVTGTGLRAASRVRTAKIATISADSADPVGRAPQSVTSAVLRELNGRLGR